MLEVDPVELELCSRCFCFLVAILEGKPTNQQKIDQIIISQFNYMDFSRSRVCCEIVWPDPEKVLRFRVVMVPDCSLLVSAAALLFPALAVLATLFCGVAATASTASSVDCSLLVWANEPSRGLCAVEEAAICCC